MRISIILLICATAAFGRHASLAEVQQATTAIRLRAAMLPTVNETGNAALNSLATQLDQATATKARQVPAAQLVAVGGSSGVSATDPLATIASRTRATLVIRTSIAASGNQLRLAATAVNPTNGATLHRFVESSAIADAASAIERLSSRITGMLATHADPEKTMPHLYSVSTIEAYRVRQRAESTFNFNQAAAYPLLIQAYELDTMNVAQLFLAAVVHRNAGRMVPGDSLLAIIEARRDRITDIEKLNMTWLKGTPREQFEAARTGMSMDRLGWGFAVGIRANAMGYYQDAVEGLSLRTELIARGSNNAKTWGGWRTQLFTALHATGDYARELSEVRLARSELRRGDDLYVTEEARALAALGRSDEARAIANRLMSRQPASSVNINQLTIVALELKRHGAKAAGEALLSDIAAFALANESQLDSLAVASVLGAAGKYAESLARLEKLTATSTNQTRISRHGQVAALSGRRELAGQLAARITGATAAADMNRGYIAAASGDCPRAVAYFQGAHEKGFAFGAPGWWHNFVPTEPIWGCEAFNKLPPMKAPPR